MTQRLRSALTSCCLTLVVVSLPGASAAAHRPAELVSMSSTGLYGKWGYWGGCSTTGRSVAFSAATVGWFPANTVEARYVYVRDRKTGLTELVSVSNSGEAAQASEVCSTSADGRFVAFASSAGNLGPGRS